VGIDRGNVAKVALYDLVSLRGLDVGKDVFPTFFRGGGVSSGVTQVLRFHVAVTGLTGIVTAAMVFPLSLGDVIRLTTGETLVHHLARDDAFLVTYSVSPVTCRGATRSMAIPARVFFSLLAVVRKTHVAVFGAVVAKRFLVRHETVLTKVGLGEEARDVRNGVKVLLDVVVVYEDLLSLLVVIGADEGELVSPGGADDVHVDV
jgi:hypothetical protein